MVCDIYSTKGEPRVLKDDTVTVYGVCAGLITYETTIGSSLSIPGMGSHQIVIHD